MRIFKCADISEIDDDIIDSISNSAVECVGLRKAASVKAKVVHYTEPGYSEPKRCKHSVCISRKRKENDKKKEAFIAMIENERRLVELEDTINFWKNQTADLTV